MADLPGNKEDHVAPEPHPDRKRAHISRKLAWGAPTRVPRKTTHDDRIPHDHAPRYPKPVYCGQDEAQAVQELFDRGELQQRPRNATCPPSFFIIGCRKGGSTSLFKYIIAHPHVRGVKADEGALSGEIEFFSNDKWFGHISSTDLVVPCAGDSGLQLPCRQVINTPPTPSSSICFHACQPAVCCQPVSLCAFHYSSSYAKQRSNPCGVAVSGPAEQTAPAPRSGHSFHFQEK